MKKTIIKILAVMCSAIMLLSIPFGCKGRGKDSSSIGGTQTSQSSSGGQQTQPQQYNPETRPLVFSIGALDNNFNPFFSTTANDGAVAGMTQIGMLSSDSNGQPDVGEDVSCVVLDYSETMYDANGNVTTAGDMNGRTEYEFVIKNGIKYSDGEPLTIKDVLFNLYVYLDPAYSGSSTIYSTDIQGLKAYRAQDPLQQDGSEENFKDLFYRQAQARLQVLRDYWGEDKVEPETEEAYAQMEADIAKVKELFLEEVTTDWNNNAGSLESYEEEYSFTEDWQVYFLMEGIISVRTEKNANGATVKMKDANGKYLTTLDDNPTTEIDETSPLVETMEEAVSEENINAYLASHAGATEADAKAELYKQAAIEAVYNSYTRTDDSLSQIVTYWATATNALQEFADEEMSKYFAGLGDMPVKSISGITTYKTSMFKNKSLGEEHDVLKIVINGIDPKAIWNFAFTVAPMHYYSGTFEGVDYVKTFNPENGNFGLKFGSKDFMDTVIADQNKNLLPMGAGTYMASNANGGIGTKETFVENNVVYYVRNPYFYTVGKELCNAKIKYFRYKVTGDSGILDALISKNIDFGEPSATTANVNKIGNYSHLAMQEYATGGYGYVGINPKAIPNHYVREAIMHSMDPVTYIISSYYSGGRATPIYRPMSSTSWAYPEGCTEYYELWTYDYNYVEKIQSLLRLGGCKQGTDLNDQGVAIWKDEDGKNLKFTFTIAGETDDHPAFGMFKETERYLESCGFEISVKTDIQALKKLATGDLEVWAAAWSSGIDPDMYQVYHKDSTATSVRNWGYPQILNDTTGKYEYEYEIIMELSDKIEEGRETLNQQEREQIYAEALDLIMDLCVEFPTYQRNDLAVYNTDVIDSNTLNSKATHYDGVVSKLWEVNYN
ncbi:MAG: hypothetical protein IKC36_03540 [Clostridia bacterium]|nr:hypothetical protein [Clostridia bacterium]